MQTAVKRLLAAIIAGLAVIGLASPARTEVLEFRRGGYLEGTIQDVADQSLVIKTEDAVLTIQLGELTPYTVYRVLSGRLKDPNPEQHWKLGEYCLENELFSTARKEFDAAVAQDPARAEAAKAKVEAIAAKERQRQLDDARALVQAGRFDEALERLRALLAKNPEGDFSKQVKDAMANLTEEVKRQTAERQKSLAEDRDKKAQDAAQRDQLSAKALTDQAAAAMADGRKASAAALENEALGKSTLAQRAFEDALTKFKVAGELWERAALAKGVEEKDREAARARREEADKLLAATLTQLGSFYALQGSYREAIKWLDRALAVEPLNPVAASLKLTVTQAIIQGIGTRGAQPILPPH